MKQFAKSIFTAICFVTHFTIIDDMALYELYEQEITLKPSSIINNSKTPDVILNRVSNVIQNSACVEPEATAKTNRYS